jgi:VCBS repeat-containing protein
LQPDYRLTAQVSGSPPQVVARSLSRCEAGSFPPGAAISGSYPVGRNNGASLGAGAFADVVELSIPRTALIGANSVIRVAFGAESATGSLDAMFTGTGAPGGGDMLIGEFLAVPFLSVFGLLLTALLLSERSQAQGHRGAANLMLFSALFTLSLAALAAANFVDDGQVADWAGVNALGTDPVGDSVPPQAASDIVAGFGVLAEGRYYFRMDLVDLENRPPITAPDAYPAREDTVLNIAAPGVLANDSDPDGNPISAQLVTGPSRGALVLNPNGGFVYTPNANANGTDTFTYNAFDGQAPSSPPTTVTITIAPVNDAPSFVAGPNQTLDKDTGPQTVNAWATAINDGDPEVTQLLSFEIASNSNAGLFSAGPRLDSVCVMMAAPPTVALMSVPCKPSRSPPTPSMTPRALPPALIKPSMRMLPRRRLQAGPPRSTTAIRS